MVSCMTLIPVKTLITCMSLGGDFVPPLVTFSRKNMNEQLMKGAAPPGVIASCHPSGPD